MSTSTYYIPYKSSFERKSYDLESLFFKEKFSLWNLVEIKLKLLQFAWEFFMKSVFKDFDTVMRSFLCRFTTKNPEFEAKFRLKFQLVKDNGVDRNSPGNLSYLTSIQCTMYSLTILALRGVTCRLIRGK